VIKVEINIFVHLFNKINLQFVLLMSEGTKVLQLTIPFLFKRLAKLGSIHFWMIELLFTIVSIVTILKEGAFNFILNERAEI